MRRTESQLLEYITMGFTLHWNVLELMEDKRQGGAGLSTCSTYTSQSALLLSNIKKWDLKNSHFVWFSYFNNATQNSEKGEPLVWNSRRISYVLLVEGPAECWAVRPPLRPSSFTQTSPLSLLCLSSGSGTLFRFRSLHACLNLK